MRLVKIQSTVLGTASATVSLSSIPQTYTDLYVLVFAKNNDSGRSLSNFEMKINGETTGYYSYNSYRYDDGTSSGSGGNAQQTNASFLRIGNNTQIGGQYDTGANPFSLHRLYFPNYSATDRYKTINYRGGSHYMVTGYSRVGWSFGLIDGTAAITSMTFNPESGGQFIAGSRFELYGIA